MKATELRIGNLFQDKYTKDVFKVLELTTNSIVFDYFTVKKWKAEPIPLTEEWLLKFGFKKAPLVDKYLKGYFTYDSKLKYFTYFTDIEDGGYENIIIQKEKLKYVHQLQNLYFALTGEELILKN